MLISSYKNEDGEVSEASITLEQEQEQQQQQHQHHHQHQQRLRTCRQQPQPPHSAGSSITSPLVRGIKRQLNFDFAGEPSSPLGASSSSTAVCIQGDGGGAGCCSEYPAPALSAVEHAPVPDLGRLLENITQASIYQKRMRRRNSSGTAACPKAAPLQASTGELLAMTIEPPSAPVSASCLLGEAVGQAGGYKKYLRDRYLSSREDSSGCYGGGGGNSSSSHPSVDLDSPDPFTPPSAPPVMASKRGGLHVLHQHQHLAAAAVASALASELLQHRMCQSAPQTPQQAALSSPPPALFLFPPNRRSAVASTAAATGAIALSGIAPTTPTGRGGGHICSVCGRTFNRSDMLNRHARLHSNTRPYECNLCPQAFSRSDHLTTHMRTHTGDKPFHCNVCNYTACRRDMITRHMKIHAKHSASNNSNAGSSEGSIISAGDEETGSPIATAAASASSSAGDAAV